MQLHTQHCSGQPACEEVALKPPAARMDEGRYSNEGSRVKRGEKNQTQNPTQPAAQRGRLEQRNPRSAAPLLPSRSSLPLPSRSSLWPPTCFGEREDQ